jgi:hypothetical protein
LGLCQQRRRSTQQQQQQQHGSGSSGSSSAGQQSTQQQRFRQRSSGWGFQTRAAAPFSRCGGSGGAQVLRYLPTTAPLRSSNTAVLKDGPLPCGLLAFA